MGSRQPIRARSSRRPPSPPKDTGLFGEHSERADRALIGLEQAGESALLNLHFLEADRILIGSYAVRAELLLAPRKAGLPCRTG